MKRTLANLSFALSLLGVAACSHSKPAEAKGPVSSNPDSPDPQVDPTMPSWAPASCKAYHTAVVDAQGCSVIEQTTRDEMKAKYEAANASWKAMTDAPQGEIEKISAACADDAKAVHAASDGKCAPAKP